MKIFLPIIIVGATITLALFANGQEALRPNQLAQTEQPAPKSATEQVQILTKQVGQLQAVIEYQQQKINQLEQQNLQMFVQLRTQEK